MLVNILYRSILKHWYGHSTSTTKYLLYDTAKPLLKKKENTLLNSHTTILLL